MPFGGDENVFSELSSVTEGRRALDYFTNRHEFTRLFIEYLHNDPPSDRILFFHGVGGNGKSLLLSFLQNNCCRRLRSIDEWESLKKNTDSVVETTIKHLQPVRFYEVPTALLDFQHKPYDKGSNNITQQAHKFLEEHYRSQGELPESLYHAICQNKEQGMEEWVKVYRDAREHKNYELCRTLQEIRTGLSI